MIKIWKVIMKMRSKVLKLLITIEEVGNRDCSKEDNKTKDTAEEIEE